MMDRGRMEYASHHTKQYRNDHLYDNALQERSFEEPAKLFVINGDCLETAIALKHVFPQCHPAVLNMASANHPGGGWRNGLVD